MPKQKKIIKIAIDGNEANVKNRVGSNVFAFEIIKNLEKITKKKKHIKFSILLSQEPIGDFPKPRKNWQYKIITPKKLWTRWALPIHLFLHRKDYELFFTPGHYAPKFSTLPYISTVMDLAFLEYPDQFRKSDYLQLKHWTKESVEHAKKVITISQFSKNEIIKHYKKNAEDVAVIYPDVSLAKKPCLISKEKAFFRKYKIKKPYFLFIGTFQPRKNLISLIEAFEKFCRSLAAGELANRGRVLKRNKKRRVLPQLVLVGKLGWLTNNLIKRIKDSSFKKQIICTDFVQEELKPSLYQNSLSTILLGLYEGFGIPPLEALHYYSIPLVSSGSSLPEVVGKAGILADPKNINSIASAMQRIWKLTARQKAIYRKQARLQIKKFSWKKSARQVLMLLEEEAKQIAKT
ncbi:MAG: glycosyltransferase family 1 protein [Candidatus Woesebacteria bacterium]